MHSRSIHGFAHKTIELDLALLDEVRRNLPVLNGTRPQAYSTEPRVLKAEASNDKSTFHGVMK
jgi:hypothetical protein